MINKAGIIYKSLSARFDPQKEKAKHNFQQNLGADLDLFAQTHVSFTEMIKCCKYIQMSGTSLNHSQGL